jgi:hypothetical protein
MLKTKENLVDDDEDDDELVPDTKFRRIISMSKETQDRRDRDPRLAEIGWPVKVKYPGSGPKAPGFRFRSHIKRFQNNLLELALEKRDRLFGKLDAEGDTAAE